jgi:hypothetical protein
VPALSQVLRGAVVPEVPIETVALSCATFNVAGLLFPQSLGWLGEA